MKWNPEDAEMDWFINGRFGLFIHWGIYALAARHEWVMQRERIRPDKYRKYFEHFDPDLYRPREWARLAKQAGMKYFVVTTKHHDGFCLWDSKFTDYKAPNTPASRDLLLPLIEAFRAEGLRVGLYHSLIDWHHPEFPIDRIHAQRDDREFKEQAGDRDMAKYRTYLFGQVEELLSQYGRIDYMWFDFSYPGEDGKGAREWHSEELEDLVLSLQPEIILNDRLDLGRGVKTPEQVQPREGEAEDGEPVIWEACQTMNGSWGYDRDNLNFKSPELLIKMLIDTVSKGGNMLLNVGPTARGQIDFRSKSRLEEIGEWMELHGRAIYGAGPSDLTPPSDLRFTQRGDRLYVHIFSWPFRHLHLDNLARKVRYAQLLHDGSEVPINRENDGSLTLELPVVRPEVKVPVIELFLN